MLRGKYFYLEVGIIQKRTKNNIMKTYISSIRISHLLLRNKTGKTEVPFLPPPSPPPHWLFILSLKSLYTFPFVISNKHFWMCFFNHRSIGTSPCGGHRGPRTHHCWILFFFFFLNLFISLSTAKANSFRVSQKESYNNKEPAGGSRNTTLNCPKPSCR